MHELIHFFSCELPVCLCRHALSTQAKLKSQEYVMVSILEFQE